MNNREITLWKLRHPTLELKSELPCTVDEVYFYHNNVSLCYSYKNARGLIFADNGYCGIVDGEKKYYPLFRVAPQYSNEHRYNPTCKPTLEAAAEAVKESWEKFIS